MRATTAYSEARRYLRTGDLLATDTPGPIGIGIKLVTEGPVSHVCGVIVERDRVLVPEATFAGGVRLVAMSRWMHERRRGPVYWWPANFTEAEQGSYKQEIFDLLGADYEHPLSMLTRVALRRKVKKNDRWFCSEIEAQARLAARPKEFTYMVMAGRDCSQIWPVHLANHYGGLNLAVQLTRG